jgi:sugar lactone lactonase YvrE
VQKFTSLPDGQFAYGTTVGTGLRSAISVAVDGNGNIYIVDMMGNQVVKETPSGSNYIQSTIASLTIGGLRQPVGVAVDTRGNVFIADGGNDRILQETPSANSYTQRVAINALQHGITSIAVDESDNLYFTDRVDHTAVKATLVSGNYYQNLVGEGGPGIPTEVAVDSNGNVYIAGGQAGIVFAETLLNGYYMQFPFNLGQMSPSGITVDGNGNLYIAGSGIAGVLDESPAYKNSFGAVNIESPGSGPLPMAFTFDTAGILGSTAVLTQGAIQSALRAAASAEGRAWPYCVAENNGTSPFDVSNPSYGVMDGQWGIDEAYLIRAATIHGTTRMTRSRSKAQWTHPAIGDVPFSRSRVLASRTTWSADKTRPTYGSPIALSMGRPFRWRRLSGRLR